MSRDDLGGAHLARASTERSGEARTAVILTLSHRISENENRTDIIGIGGICRVRTRKIGIRVEDQATRWGAGLSDAGALWAAECAEWYVHFLSCCWRGFIPLPGPDAYIRMTGGMTMEGSGLRVDAGVCTR